MKISKFIFPLIMFIVLLSGCGSSNASNNDQGSTEAQTTPKDTSAPEAEGYVPEKLSVQFVPSQNADTLEAKAKPLEKLLGEKLGIPVEVSVSTDYNTVIEAMASKKVDIGFLPPTAYVLAKEKGAAEVILQAQRFGVQDDTGAPTDELVDFYKAMIIVKKDSDIKTVSDLKGKKIAYQNVTSSAGFVWPAATMMAEGLDPLKDVQAITVKGHDQAVLAVLNGDVDAAAIFQDARNTVIKDYPTVFDETRILAFTDKIPNDTIAARPDLNKEWVEKIQQAFIDIAADDEGHQMIKDIYSHEGYVKSQESNFDIVREYNEKVKTE